jgi:hypothetical protein
MRSDYDTFVASMLRLYLVCTNDRWIQVSGSIIIKTTFKNDTDVIKLVIFDERVSRPLGIGFQYCFFNASVS